ncbi:AGRG2 protein, partial [Polypterus senegalus]
MEADPSRDAWSASECSSATPGSDVKGAPGAHPVENKRACLLTVCKLESGVGAGRGAREERKGSVQDAGNWSTLGCTTLVEDNVVTCGCHHLSNFAVLMKPYDLTDQQEKESDTLTYISYIGCGLSAFFMTVVILDQPISSAMSQQTSIDQSWFIHLSLAGALLLLNIGFLCSAAIPAIRSISWLCTTTGLFLHFFLICTFTWMALEAYQMFMLMCRRNHTSLKAYGLKVCFVGWGVPALIVLSIVTIKRDSYGVNGDMCWVTNNIVTYVSVIGYFGLVFIFTTGVLAAVLCKLTKIWLASKQAMKEKRSSSEVTGKRIVVLSDNKGDMRKIQALNPNTKTITGTISVIYRPKSEQYPNGHYDVCIKGKVVTVSGDGKVYTAVARGLDPDGSESKVTEKATELKALSSKTLTENVSQWSVVIQRKKWVDEFRGVSIKP